MVNAAAEWQAAVLGFSVCTCGPAEKKERRVS